MKRNQAIQRWLIVWLMFLLGCALVYPIHIPISYFETDFIDYCVAVESFSHPSLKMPTKRAGLAGLLPYSLSHFVGVINGIAWSSLICLGVIFAILNQWTVKYTEDAKSIFVSSTLFLCAGPVLSMSRMLNFYPEITVVFVVASFLLFCQLRNPTGPGFSLALFAALLCFSIDVRGMVWGSWFLLVLMTSAIIRRKWIWGLFSIPIFYLGAMIGQSSYHKLHSPLSRQMDVRPLFHTLEPDNLLYQPPYAYPEGFLFGRSSLMELLNEVLFLFQQTRLEVPEKFYSYSAVSEGVWWYWLICLVLTCCSLLWLLFRDRRRGIILLLSILPFLVAYIQLPSVVEPHIRFYAQTMPVFIVVVAIALHSLIKNQTLVFRAGFSILFLFLSVTLVPKWSVSRVILNAHVQMAFPNAEQIFKDNQIGAGYEVHLYTSPITKTEQFLQSSWFDYCNNRLSEDGVLVPFYQPLERTQ